MFYLFSRYLIYDYFVCTLRRTIRCIEWMYLQEGSGGGKVSSAICINIYQWNYVRENRARIPNQQLMCKWNSKLTTTLAPNKTFDKSQVRIYAPARLQHCQYKYRTDVWWCARCECVCGVSVSFSRCVYKLANSEDYIFLSSPHTSTSTFIARMMHVYSWFANDIHSTHSGSSVVVHSHHFNNNAQPID